jgi:hypothetical protein
VAKARSNDSNSLKHRLEYTLGNPDVLMVQPPLTRAAPKSDRGWRHPVTRHMLCPRAYRDDLHWKAEEHGEEAVAITV